MPFGVDTEVIVIGAGPAGSTAARTLAERNVDVILVDREEFPRYKTCGGGITGVTQSCIPPGMPIREEIYRASFTLRGNGEQTREAATPILSMVARDEFDDWLLKKAIEQGATFLPGTMVRSAHAADRHVSLETGNDKRLTAHYLVDASGTSSRIARQIGVVLQTVDLGLELEIAADPSESRWNSQIHLDWGPIPGSYGWLFPKDTSYTVGVIGAKEHGSELKAYLEDFVRQLGLESAEVLKDTGHLTRCRSPQSPLGARQILLAGDAAGFLEPWTREGISFATRSGRIAGEVIATAMGGRSSRDTLAQNYRCRLEESILPEMKAGFAALRAFQSHPEVLHWLMKHIPLAWKYFTRIATGDTTLAHDMRHAPVRAIVAALSRL